jgi:pyruvate kinase
MSAGARRRNRKKLPLVRLNCTLTDRRPPDFRVPEIMATVGPTLEKGADLLSAIRAGARWFRLPCGYRERPHVQNALAVRKASAEAGIPVRLLLDLPSSRPRTGNMPEARLKAGDRVIFWDSACGPSAPAGVGSLAVPLPGLGDFVHKLMPGHSMWFCDGRLSFVVEDLNGQHVLARLQSGEVPLKSSNSLFLPETRGAFTAITSADRRLFTELTAADLCPDWIALSLIASPEDVQSAREQIHALLAPDIRIMAKFETSAAVDCLDGIVEIADGIMVARGDLGLAVGYGRLAGVQEDLVEAARRAGKEVIVATQILEGFAQTGVPQRAELTDLAVIARQQATGLMFGKETVFSPRPIECIRFAIEVMSCEVRRLERRQAARIEAMANIA